MYDSTSISEKGTLKQLQTLIGRSGIPVRVKDDPRAVEDFLEVVLDAHVIAAAISFFGMVSKESKPTVHIDVDVVSQFTTKDQWKELSEVIKKFIKQFLLSHLQDGEGLCPIQTVQSVVKTKQKKSTSKPKPSCASGSRKQSTTKKQSPSDQSTSDGNQDYVLNYTCHLLGMCLFSRNFHDASKEGDGERLIRCWKFLLLHFKVDHRVKYALEAFNLLAQVNCLLPAHKAHQLIWNRTCNFNGGKGNNIPLDLQLEHLNRVFKDNINTFRANISETSVCRSSRVIGPLKELMDKFDKSMGIKVPTGKHVGPSTEKDFDLILRVLLREDVFNRHNGRAHKTFPTISSDPFVTLKNNPTGLQLWLKQRIKIASIEQDFRMNLL